MTGLTRGKKSIGNYQSVTTKLSFVRLYNITFLLKYIYSLKYKLSLIPPNIKIKLSLIYRAQPIVISNPKIIHLNTWKKVGDFNDRPSFTNQIIFFYRTHILCITVSTKKQINNIRLLVITTCWSSCPESPFREFLPLVIVNIIEFA